ncbi:MAG: carboxypeptidase regulatory-like domain-containing protein [Bryobacteraceae bacterium]|nr:carboxypeptidase regulatory-like domain-containing protein [Bryobacteraceae bacterium]
MLSFEQFLTDTARLPRPWIHRLLTPLLAALLTAALLPAAPNQAPAPGRDTVTILVVDPLGNPLPGASIEVTEGDSTMQWKTDDKGKAEFWVVAGEHSARISAPGFWSRTIRISANWFATWVVGLEIGIPSGPPRSNFQVRVSPEIPLGELNMVILKVLYTDREYQARITAARTGWLATQAMAKAVAILVVDGEVRFTGTFDLVQDVGGIELTPEGITPLPRP